MEEFAGEQYKVIWILSSVYPVRVKLWSFSITTSASTSTKSPIRATTLTSASSQSQSAHGCPVSASSSAMQQCMLAASSAVASIWFSYDVDLLGIILVIHIWIREAFSQLRRVGFECGPAEGWDYLGIYLGCGTSGLVGDGRDGLFGVGSRGDTNDAPRGMKQRAARISGILNI